MKASRFRQIVLFGLLMTLILGCDLLGNVSTPLAPSGAQLLGTSSVQATTASLAVGTAPEATAIPATQTLVPSTPILGPAILHLAAGQTFDITHIHMVDAKSGLGNWRTCRG